MNPKLIDLFTKMRRYNRVPKFMPVIVLVLGWGGLRVVRARLLQPPHARQDAQAMYRRATGICAALGDVCAMETHPQYTERSVHCYSGDRTPLRTWKFSCDVDGRAVSIILNDATGGLCYLVADRARLHSPACRSLASIANGDEAAEVGFQRLKAMQLLPHGALIALDRAPHLSRIKDTWNMTWNVKRTVQSAPYKISLVLDRVAHMPVSVTDTSNLSVTAH